MDDVRFDRIAQNVSRRGLAPVIAPGVLAGSLSDTVGARRRKGRRPCLRKPPPDTCGGFPPEYS